AVRPAEGEVAGEPRPPFKGPESPVPAQPTAETAADSRRWRDVELQVGPVAKTLLEGSRLVSVDGCRLRVAVDAEFKVKKLTDKRAEIDPAVTHVFGPG